MKKLFWLAAILYVAAWVAHLVIGTLALRGFFADGSLAFLINLSHSYVFGGDGRWVHLFAVGFPRDAQLFLNSLGLQAALLLHVTNPLYLKYVFVFWQFALPGLLYLVTIAVCVRSGRGGWAIFPLLSWAVLSPPVDWNAINSTRWAIPLFWMHLYIVLFAGPRLRPAPTIAAVFLGILMLGGLYESVVLQAALTLLFGALVGIKTKNRVPLIYASFAVPGALRAIFTYVQSGHTAPNGFSIGVISDGSVAPLFVFALTSLGLALSFAFARARPTRDAPRLYTIAFLLTGTGLILLLDAKFEMWWQANEMRFWYLILSFGLMATAALLQLRGWSPTPTAMPVAIIALLAGFVLWIAQSQQTGQWKTCLAAYDAQRGDAPLLLSADLAPLAKPSDKIVLFDRTAFSQCLWDWTTPWSDLLRSPDGRINQWALFTFWQDFSFIEKSGTVYLHTNNWTLTSPSMQQSQADLPLKTLLYDLTPLYRASGMGPLLQRTGCVDPDSSGNYWRRHLRALNDDKRREMFVCPSGAAPR